MEEQYLPLTGPKKLDALRWYYENNATYDRLATALRGVPGSRALKGIKPLENPAHKTVEFYAAKLFPRDLEDALEAPESLKKPISEVWKWSNWEQRRRVAARWDAMYGNLYIKVASSEDQERVFFQLLDPRFVTYFETDERDYFTYLRIDTPQERRTTDDELESYWVTEIYDKEAQSYRAWEHDEGEEAELKEIKKKGKVIENQILAETPIRDDDRRYTGFDFIPIVHVKFRDIGNPLGQAAFAHCLEAIDQLNLDLTKLDEMLFPAIHLALRANAQTPEGRPIDAPVIDSSVAEADYDDEGNELVKIRNQVLWRLPGLSQIESVVPNIDFSSHLEAIDAALMRLEKMLPELAYYRLRDMQEISGRAARILLGDVIDRVTEARDNILAGLIRANQMALSIGKALGLEGFDSLGDYKSGALDHSFEEVDIFPISDLEEAEAKKAMAEADEAQERVYELSKKALRERAGIEEREAAPQQEREVISESPNGDALQAAQLEVTRRLGG